MHIAHKTLLVRVTTYLHTPFLLCLLILHIGSWIYSLMSTLKDRFLRNFFIFLLTTLIFAKESAQILYFVLLEMSYSGFRPWPHV